MTEYLVSPQQFQLETMNDDDFLGSSPYYSTRVDVGHGSDRGETVLSDIDALAELRRKMEGAGYTIMDTAKGTDSVISDMHRGMEDIGERTKIIQSQQKISHRELALIPEDRREEFLDHVKERALQGMIEQADLINAVSYEEDFDPMTHEKIIIAKLKVIIE